MAVRSSLSPSISFLFKARPICSTRIKPLLLVSFKAFSSQTSNAPPKAENTPSSVGFLGIGIMGLPMAQNLLKAGCELTVWNRTKSKCDPLITSGAKYKSSPEEVTASCDVTFAMLADPESAVDIAYGKNGAANGLSPEKGYVDVSTVDGSTSKLIGEHIKATGALFLEAPVSGSKKPAEDGQLIFLTAGKKYLQYFLDPYFRMARDVAPWIGHHKPALIESLFFPALQVDIPVKYLNFFLEDDAELDHIQKAYGNGEMLTSEVKNRLAKILTGIVERHRRARAGVTEEMVDAFMAKRPLPSMFD